MYVIVCGILVYANLEKMINIRSPWIIGYYCDTTKTTKAVSVTANCSLVSVSACSTGSFECHENCSKRVWKIMNNQMIVCIFWQLLLLWSKRNSHFTLVAAHFSSRGEVGKETNSTNTLDNQTRIIISQPAFTALLQNFKYSWKTKKKPTSFSRGTRDFFKLNLI